MTVQPASRPVRAAVVLASLLALLLTTVVTGSSASAAVTTTLTGTVSTTASHYLDLTAGTTVRGTLTWTSPTADVKLSLRGPGGVVLAADSSTARPKTLSWTVAAAGRYRWYLTTKVATAYSLASTTTSPVAPVPATSPAPAPAPTTTSPDPASSPTTGPPVRSGGLTAPTTRTLTPAAFLAEARATGLVTGVTIAGSLVLDDPRDTWTCRECRVVASGRYGLSSFSGTTTVPGNGRGTRWEHSEVDGAGIATTAVLGSYLTWVDGNVHGATSDLFKPFRHVTVLRGQAHSIRKAVGAHADVIQIVNGRSILVDGLWTDATEPDGGNLNAVLQMGALNGDVVDVVLRGMWVNGGHYSLRGIDTTAAESPYTVSGFRLEDNWFGPDHTYGPLTALGPRTTVTGNRWGFTGTTRSTRPRTVVLGQPV